MRMKAGTGFPITVTIVVAAVVVLLLKEILS